MQECVILCRQYWKAACFSVVLVSNKCALSVVPIPTVRAFLRRPQCQKCVIIRRSSLQTVCFSLVLVSNKVCLSVVLVPRQCDSPTCMLQDSVLLRRACSNKVCFSLGPVAKKSVILRRGFFSKTVRLSVVVASHKVRFSVVVVF